MLDHIKSGGTLHLYWTDLYARQGLSAALLHKKKDEVKYFLEQYYENVVIRKGEDSPSAICARNYHFLIDFDHLEDTDDASFFRELQKELSPLYSIPDLIL